jgi:tripartite-type tricarboxylate transporter receptor subunit TctC
MKLHFRGLPGRTRRALFGTAIRTLAVLPAMAVLCGAAAAAYPERPVRLIVPFTAGGAADVMARGMAQRLGEELGQQVIVDNRGGAGGIMAAELAIKAPADGYTLFFGTMGTQAINPALRARLPYDPIEDFAPISITHINPRVLVVGPSVKAASIDELIALARSKPGTLTYGSAGVGSSGHLSGVLFGSMTGVEMVHVPYRGSAPLLTDVLSGRVDMTFDSYTVYEDHIRSGRVRALGVTSKDRVGALPEVPTIAEQGLKGYDVSNWLGVLAPAGTPPGVVKTIHGALGRAMATPELRRHLTSLGIEPVFGTPEEFAALIKADIPKWAEIVRKSGAKAE